MARLRELDRPGRPKYDLAKLCPYFQETPHWSPQVEGVVREGDWSTAKAEQDRLLIRNLGARMALIERCHLDEAFRARVWWMCERDPLFWLNMFAVTLDPRLKITPRVPFTPYVYQQHAFMKLIDCITNGGDLVSEKSRDMGATWIMVAGFTYIWLFRPMSQLLLVSRKEEYVDKKGNEKTLFAKVDMIVNNLPPWMRPRMDRKVLHLKNLDNGSTIDGESTTGDVARGDRRLAIMLDEFASVPIQEQGNVIASVRDVTNCVLYNSTPKGKGTPHYQMVEKARQGDIELVRMHWIEHPVKAQGLYEGEDGKDRSPWYDAQCKRARFPAEIAQELDIDYSGADFMLFDPVKLEDHRREYCLPPLYNLVLKGVTDDPKKFEVMKSESYNHLMLRVWCELDEETLRPTDANAKYVMGVDVSSGTGSSNSSIVVGDALTGRVVAEFTSPHVDGISLARYVYGIGHLFKDRWGDPAHAVVEINGPGRVCMVELNDRLEYENIYHRKKAGETFREDTKQLGFHSKPDTKMNMWASFKHLLESGRVIVPSEQILDELEAIIYSNDSNAIIHSRSRMKDDPTGARDAHGDRGTAAALMCQGIIDTTDDPTSVVRADPEIRPGTLAWRNRQHEQMENEGSFAWLRRGSKSKYRWR